MNSQTAMRRAAGAEIAPANTAAGFCRLDAVVLEAIAPVYPIPFQRARDAASREKRSPDPEDAMSARLKKLIGLFILLPAIALYLFVAAAIADFLPDRRIVKLIYFIVAGVAWAPPARYLILWMNADPPRRED